MAVIDVDADRVSRVLHLDESATAVAYGYDTAWIGTYGLYSSHADGQVALDDSRIEAFRAGKSKPAKIVLDKHANWGPVSIAVGAGAVWALTGDESGNQLLKINPITLRITHHLDLSAVIPDAVAVGAGGVWTVNDHSVTKIDPHTDTVIKTFPLVRGKAGQLCGIAATRRELWVTSGHIFCDTIGS